MIDWSQEEEVKAEAHWLMSSERCPGCGSLIEAHLYVSDHTLLVSLVIKCKACSMTWEKHICDWITGEVLK